MSLEIKFETEINKGEEFSFDCRTFLQYCMLVWKYPFCLLVQSFWKQIHKMYPYPICFPICSVSNREVSVTYLRKRKTKTFGTRCVFSVQKGQTGIQKNLLSKEYYAPKCCESNCFRIYSYVCTIVVYLRYSLCIYSCVSMYGLCIESL